MKTVVITNAGSLYGKKILNYFRWREIPVESVLVIRQPIGYYWKLFAAVRRRVGFSDALYYTYQRVLGEAQRNRMTEWQGRAFIGDYAHLGIPIAYSTKTNSPQTIEILQALSPDVIVLGQTGIVRDSVLRIPKIGALNAHPGILPNYRGIDCGWWAIYDNNFDGVGSTVHWVDAGVDTGNIILQQPYAFAGDEKLNSLDDRLYDQCVELLARVVDEIQRGQILRGAPQNSRQGKQCYKMSRRDHAIAQANLARYFANRQHRSGE